MTETDTPLRLNGLQAGRAIAALMVVIFHANIFILPDQIYGDGTNTWVGFNFGYAGVEFFFALSGFIMVFIHKNDFGRPKRLVRFLRKRIERIYPVYWVVLAGLIVIYNVMPDRGPPTASDPVHVLASFALFPMPEEPIMIVAWTLQFEMLFYLMFGLIILNRPVGTFVFAIWMAGCFARMLTPELSYPFEFIFSYYNLIFLAGIAAAVFYSRVPAQWVLPLGFAGTFLFFFYGLYEILMELEWDHGVRTVLLGVFAAMVIAALARGASLYKLRTPKWLVFLGDASYAIYLAHVPVMTAASIVIAKLGLTWIQPVPMFLLCVCIGTLGGIVTHLLVERPIMTLFRKWHVVKSQRLTPS